MESDIEARAPRFEQSADLGQAVVDVGLRASLRRQTLTLVVIYAVSGAAWLAISEGVLRSLVPDAALRGRVTVLSGFAFVATSAALLSFLLRRAARKAEKVLVPLERNQAERLLHDVLCQQADAIVESADDAIVSKTLSGTVTRWNLAAQRMFGYTAAEMVGRSIDVLIPRDRAEEEPLILRRITNGERIEQFETTRVRKDGVAIPVAITFSPTWGPDPAVPRSRKIVGVSKIVRDVTARKKAEEAAQREQRFARNLVEAVPGIFYLYDQQGRFLRWNSNFETVSGYSAQEIARMHPLDFFAREEKDLLQQRIAEVFETGESSVEASFVAKDGRAIPYLFTGKRIVVDDVPCLGGVGVDITKRKRAEEALTKSEARYRTTIDTILESCQLLDFDWRYLYLNGAAAVQNRRPNSELFGNRMRDVWPGIEGTPVFALLNRCMRERISVHQETEFTFADGSSGWFDIRSQPVREGIFVLSIDITERKQAERALRELNESLELKVKERTIDLHEARERAEAADRIKSSFLATMSHELRTPLNSIIGFTGIILQGLAGPLNPEQSKQLGMVQASARHLLDLINDVLDISKIEAEQLPVHLAPFDLHVSVTRMVASVAPFADKKGLAVRVMMPEDLKQLDSDQRRVEQILLNLLNNAIKFTDHGEVTLTIDVVENVGGPNPDKHVPALRIRVGDTGIGMKSEDLSRLFQPFHQIDSGLHRQHEGTGLGLAISRRLTELLGGNIAAQSTWGKGSLFTVTLPTKRIDL